MGIQQEQNSSFWWRTVLGLYIMASCYRMAGEKHIVIKIQIEPVLPRPISYPQLWLIILYPLSWKVKNWTVILLFVSCLAWLVLYDYKMLFGITVELVLVEDLCGLISVPRGGGSSGRSDMCMKIKGFCKARHQLISTLKLLSATGSVVWRLCVWKILRFLRYWPLTPRWIIFTQKGFQMRYTCLHRLQM